MSADWHIEIIEVITESGETISGTPDSEVFQEADEIFYSVETPDGEKHYRYIYGPYDSEDDVRSAITDEIDYYESLVT